MQFTKKLKVISLILLSAMALSCALPFAKTITNGQARPQLIDEYLVGSWVPYYWDGDNVASIEEQTADLAKSGMNVVSNPGMYKTWSNSMELNDMDFYNQMFEKNHMYYTYANSDFEGMVTQALINDSPALKFYSIKDEPSASQFDWCKEKFDYLQNADPTRIPSINLYPNYAGSVALGGTYEDYVRGYVSKMGAENIEYLSYDHYPFTVASGEGGYRASFFSDAETIRKVAYQNNRIKTAGCTQMEYWNGMRRPTVDMARWDVSALLAYGMKYLIHFNWAGLPYVAPEAGGEGMHEAVLAADGTKTELYVPMQKMNWQVRQLGPTLMNIDAQHAYHTANVPQGTEKLPASFFLQPTQNEDFVVSLFTSKNDSEKYIMLMNKSLDTTCTASFNVDTSFGIESMTYLKPDKFDTLPEVGSVLPAPERIEKSLANGKLTDTFLPGEFKLYKLEGNFVIPEAVQIPESSHVSGNYATKQDVRLTSYQEGVDIYYTLDGTYPVVGKGTTKKYEVTKPLVFGETKESKLYALRIIGVRGKEASLPNDYYYFIDTSQDKGTQLVGTTIMKDFTINGGVNTWAVNSTRISMTGAYESNLGNRGITYNKKKFGNVIVEMTYKMDDPPTATVAHNCHPGIGFFKESLTSALDNHDGYYAILEHAGRVGVFDGAREYGPTNIAATNFVPAGINKLKVVIVDDFLSIAVNGKTCYTIRDARIAREKGYIAILAAQMPITVTSFTIKELNEENINGKANTPESTILNQLTVLSKAVGLYTKFADVVAGLPSTIDVLDSNGVTRSISIASWVCNHYDRKEMGNYIFNACYGTLPENLVNSRNITVECVVTVAKHEDKTILIDLIAQADQLISSNFTPESWKEFKIYLNTAKDIVKDEYVAANSIGVANMQLFNAMSALVNIVTNPTELSEEISLASALSANEYDTESWHIFSLALKNAQNVVAKPYSTQEEIDQVCEALRFEKNLLIKNVSSEINESKKALELVIQRVKALDSKLYTEESFAQLSKSLEGAENLLKKGAGKIVLDSEKTVLDTTLKALVLKADVTESGSSVLRNFNVGFSGINIFVIILFAVLALASIGAATYLFIKKR